MKTKLFENTFQTGKNLKMLNYFSFTCRRKNRAFHKPRGYDNHYPASRVSFDLPRQIGKRKETPDLPRKIEGDSARRVDNHVISLTKFSSNTNPHAAFLNYSDVVWKENI